MVCKTKRPFMAGCSGKKAVFALLACGMIFTISGCAAGNADALQDSYREEASARIFNSDGGYCDSYTETAADSVSEPEMISLESIESVGAMEIPIVDNWPESIVCVSNGMTAQPCSVTILIDEPMELSVSCIREEGKIAMRITDADGNIYFDEKKMQTEDYTVTIDKAGDYKIAFYARAWYGKITIEPIE